MNDYEVYSEESNAERMQKRANDAAKNMGWHKGKAVRDVLSDGQVRVEYPPMDIDAHNAAMNARAAAEGAEWAKNNPDAYYWYKYNTRPMPEPIMNQVSPDAYIKDKGWNHRPLPEVFAKQSEAIWNAHHPTMAQASEAPSYTMVHGRPMVETPESVSNNRLREQYLTDFRNRAAANSDGRISLSDVGELMEQYPSMFEEKPAQGPQPYTARYNGGVRIESAIPSDAALEYGQGSTRPITKEQAVANRNGDNYYRVAPAVYEGKGLPLAAQNYNQKGRLHSTYNVPPISIPAPEGQPSQSLEEAYRAKLGSIPNSEVSLKPLNPKTEYKDVAMEGYPQGGQAGQRNQNNGLWSKGMRYADGVATPAMMAGQAAKAMWDTRSGAPAAAMVGAAGLAATALAGMGMDGMMVIDGLSQMASDAQSAYQYINSGAMGRDIANLPERIKVALAEAVQERAEQSYVYDDNPNHR